MKHFKNVLFKITGTHNFVNIKQTMNLMTRTLLGNLVTKTFENDRIQHDRRAIK